MKATRDQKAALAVVVSGSAELEPEEAVEKVGAQTAAALKDRPELVRISSGRRWASPWSAGASTESGTEALDIEPDIWRNKAPVLSVLERLKAAKAIPAKRSILWRDYGSGGDLAVDAGTKAASVAKDAGIRVCVLLVRAPGDKIEPAGLKRGASGSGGAFDELPWSDAAKDFAKLRAPVSKLCR